MEDPNNNKVIKRLETMAKDQDINQKVNVALSVTLELYRVLVSSLLILFVPQNCKGELCTLEQNMETDSNLYTAGLTSNFVTMFVFCVLYAIEIKRENKLITYLEVNKSHPCDNDSVGKALQRLSEEKRSSILALDQSYQKVAYGAMICFMMNSVLSGLVVYDYYLGNQTTTTFITNVLFMIMKLVDVYQTVNTEENIFYSAYLKGKVQFNDVDPDKIKEIHIELSGREINDT
jgi:hypothetical protein